MNWQQGRLAKVWAAVSEHGLKAGLKHALARWARSQTKIPLDVVGDYGWVLKPEFPPALKFPGSRPLKINWFIPNLHRSSGGFTTLFRAIYYLEKWGHQHRIYIAEETPLTGPQATALMRDQYFPIQADIELFRGEVADSDALVATLWKTAYAVRGLGNTVRKFYFIQDLEHLFYPMGAVAEFARQTYQWGFYGITAGHWIAEVLQREFGMQCSGFGFSYDSEIYSESSVPHGGNGKKRVLFYARAITERRGFELGILALYLVARKMPDIEFVLIGLSQGSTHIPFPATYTGMIAPSELALWYRSSTVALVLSLTNLSLLPLELMACGCPVVSNGGPNVEWLLTKENAQLADSNPHSLANAILALLDDEPLRARKVAAGLAFARSTDWSSEIRKIEAAFYRGLNVGTSHSNEYESKGISSL